MFSKTIKFKDFAGNERTKEFWFHITKAEMMVLGSDESLQKRMRTAVETKNGMDIFELYRQMIRLSCGVRSEDGQTFLKTPEAQSALLDSPAFDELIMEFMTDMDAGANFVKALMPEAMQREVHKQLGINSDLNPFAEPTQIHHGTVTEQIAKPYSDVMPAWFQEGRKPTRDELIRMDQAEMNLVFRMTQEGKLK